MICDTHKEQDMKFLDIHGLNYLMSLLDSVITRRTKTMIDENFPKMAVTEDALATDADIDNIFSKEVGA